MSAASVNSTNTGATDTAYISDVRHADTLRYWVPSSSKLSRGIKGTIQRVFTGEPLNNLCNVYIYNETSKSWFHEYTITGDPNRNGIKNYPESLLTSNSTQFSGITYTTSASTNSTDAYKAFGLNLGYVNSLGQLWKSPDLYPFYEPTGWSGGTWVPGTYIGTSSLGGVSGEWLKLQLSTPFQFDRFEFRVFNYWTSPNNFTLLGSNDDSNWTNLGNYTYDALSFSDSRRYADVTMSTTYTYFAFVFSDRRTRHVWENTPFLYILGLHFITVNPSEDFGRSLDGTDNAEMVAIGAPATWFGSVSTITGYARVFTKDSSGNGWTQRGASVSQTGGFGHSVALSPYDGNILVVGAPFYNTQRPYNLSYSGHTQFRTVVSEGKVYIYKWDGTNYTLQQTLNSPSGTLSYNIIPDSWKSFYFGYSLGITDIGDKIIVGEPAIRNIWYTPDQRVTGAYSEWTDYEFPFTGNAHVYDNFTVLSGGTTWTSNVSMTSVIGATVIGWKDSNPTRVRWLDALGTSVDINRNGTRILAGAPGSYGTSTSAPQYMSGRIFTLDWDPIDAEWKEMGYITKHIAAPRERMLLGMNTRFGGSGRRIVTGCPGLCETYSYIKGEILIYDWNGDQWVNFPGENVEVIDRSWNASDHWENWQWAVGESISIDGEGEIIPFGISEHKLAESPTDANVFRPNAFNVNEITYIGGATTSVAGSQSTITTGSSNIWVYNIKQSMVVKGNVTVGGYVQATGISIGTEDDSSKSTKSLFFGGTKADNSYDLTVIENRVYDSEERAELLIFKGNDNKIQNTGGGIILPPEWMFGPDRIRLKGGQIAFDLNAGFDRTQEDIRAVMHRNTGGAGMLGINVSEPYEVIHVDGKIKCTQGFIGKGTEIKGIDLNHIVNMDIMKFDNQAGISVSPIQLGEYTIDSTVAYPTVALGGNSSSGYIVNASSDTANAYKAFNDNTSDNEHWGISGYSDYYTAYDYSLRGLYVGTTEKVSGYKGEWIELILPNPIFVTELEIFCFRNRELPRRSYTFGSNDGIEYYLIHDSGDKGYEWGTSSTYNTIYTRTPNVVTEDPYNRILIIVESLSVGGAHWYDINIYGQIATLNLNMKIDNTGKIGIGTTSPNYNLDVVGDVNFTGELSVNSNVGTYDQVLTSSGATPSWTNRVWSRLISLPSSTMTSSSSGGYTVSDSSNLGIGNEGWNAFDASSSTFWATSRNYLGSSTGSYYNGTTSTTYNGSLTVNGDWVQLQTPFSTVINKIDILPYSTSNEQCPRTGKLLGSNDGSTWTEIHGFTNQIYTTGQYTTISFINTVAYSYFRLVCEDMEYFSSSTDPRTGTTVYFDNDIEIDEIRFYGTSPNVYYNTGNVGIGTSLPGYDLDVSGDINFTGELSVNGTVGTIGQVLTSSGPGFSPTWTTVSGGGGGGYWTQTSSDIYYISGFVGIGTPNPIYHLDVDGDINFTGELNVNGSAGIPGQVLTSSGAGSVPTWKTISSGGSSYWTQSGTDLYYTTGKVGIGTNSINASLTVGGYVGGTYGYYRFFRINDSSLSYTQYGPQWSIYASNHIGSLGFFAFSDKRIKKNITDINDSSALDKIRLLEPKMYNYIDEVERGTSNVYGFIAQEVANVLPYAVTIGEGDIPNIYTNSNVIVTENSNVLELHLDAPVEGLSLSNTSIINIITDNDTTLTCNVLSFSGSNVITIENTEEFSNVTNAFIKGERISDFHSLNKDAIWAVSTAALQEVDRQLQTEKTKVATLETQVADLLARVSVLENN